MIIAILYVQISKLFIDTDTTNNLLVLHLPWSKISHTHHTQWSADRINSEGKRNICLCEASVGGFVRHIEQNTISKGRDQTSVVSLNCVCVCVQFNPYCWAVERWVPSNIYFLSFHFGTYLIKYSNYGAIVFLEFTVLQVTTFGIGHLNRVRMRNLLHYLLQTASANLARFNYNGRLHPILARVLYEWRKGLSSFDPCQRVWP